MAITINSGQSSLTVSRAEGELTLTINGSSIVLDNDDHAQILADYITGELDPDERDQDDDGAAAEPEPNEEAEG